MERARNIEAMGEDRMALYSQKLEDAPVLIVQHNLTEANLLHAERMGGIPVPSLAVTHKDHPLTRFGEITLLGGREMADPKGYAKTKVFGADIYSPRYPMVSYRFTPALIKRAESMLKKGMEATGTKYIDLDQNTPTDVSELAYSPAFMWQYLKGKGIEPQVLRIEPKPIPDAIKPFIENGMDYFELQEDPAFIEAAYRAHRDMLVVEIGEGRKEEVDMEIEKIKKDTKASGAVNYIAKGYARDIVKFRRDKASAGVIDKDGTQRALKKQIIGAGLQGDVEKAAKSFIAALGPEERIFQGFTNSGNRRYTPHTLENVVKILKKELRGGEGVNYGVGSVRAAFTPQFKSIEQIRKSKDRLMDAEAFSKVKDEIDREMESISEQLSPYHPVGGEFGFDGTVSSMLYDAAKMGIPRALEENGFDPVPVKVQQEIAVFLEKLANLPAEYFEAKILRDVDVAEFSAAVVPDDISEEALQVLYNRGISNIVKYASRNDEDRRAKIAQLADEAKLLFSKSQASVSGKTVADFQPLADKVNAKLADGYEVVVVQSEKDLPKGVRPLYQTAYYWSPYKFDRLGLEQMGRGLYGWGLYFAGNKGVAEWYRELVAKKEYNLTIDGKDIASFKWFANARISQVAFDFIASDLMRGDVDSAKEMAQRFIDRIDARRNTPDAQRGDARARDAYVRLLRLMDNGKLEGSERRGQLYEVEIPEDDTFLLWDKPFKDQPAKVQQLLGGKTGIKLDDGNWVVYIEIGEGIFQAQVPLSVYPGTEKGKQAADEYLQYTKTGEFAENTGERIYNGLMAIFPSAKDTSKYLHNLGINGIKYLDRASRDKDESSFNYVLFDDRAIDIVETYYSRGSGAIEGAYLGGKKVYIVADAIHTEQRFNEVVQHELHHMAGEMTIESNEYQRAIMNIVMLERSGNELVKELAFEVDRRQPGLDKKTRAKEIMALAAETGRYKESNVLVRMFADIVRVFKRAALKIGVKGAWLERMGIEEVFSMMRAGERAMYRNTSEQSVRHGDYAVVHSESAPWYYSALAKAIKTAPERVFNQPAAGLKLWIQANAAKLGIKADELHWTGLLDWLDTQGKALLRREQIDEYLAQGGVRLEETVLDSGSAEVKPENGGFAIYDSGEFVRWYRTRDEAEANISTLGKAGGTPKAKYTGYKLKGGTNYREFILALPDKSAKEYKIGDVVQYAGRHVVDVRIDEVLDDAPPAVPSAKYRGTRLDDGTLIFLRDKDIAATTKKESAFRSPHWDQPNVVAHMRVDTVEADGKKYLRVIEIQSDYGQAGRKRGFRGNEVKDYSAEHIGPWYPNEPQGPQKWRVYADGVEMGFFQDSTKEGAIARAKSEREHADNRVPDAPFVRDTKAWTSLIIKRAIALAAKEGMDGVVFASGQESTDLYDLRKQVKAIHYAKRGENEYAIKIIKSSASAPELIGTFSAGSLEGVVGKSVAEKIIAGEGDEVPSAPYKSLSGINLKVGGEGMLKFYDEIVPQVANDVLKKVGAGVKVETIKADTARTGFLVTPEFAARVNREGLPLFSRKLANAVDVGKPEPEDQEGCCYQQCL